VNTKGNWPPLKCQGIQWGVGDHYLLIDGHHRLAAAKKLGLKLINAEMVECKNGRDAAKAAMSANNEHGANVSNVTESPFSVIENRAFVAISLWL